MATPGFKAITKCSICNQSPVVNVDETYRLCEECAIEQMDTDRKKIRIYEKLLDFVINGGLFE